MTVATDQVVGSMPRKTKRDDEPVKLDRKVLAVARIVAATKGISLAEYLSETLRPIVQKDHDDYIRQQAAVDAEGPPPKPRASRKPSS